MQIGFIGFGEAAAAIVEGWGPHTPHRIRAFDIKTDMPALAEAKWADYARYGVDGSAGAAQALADAELVFSLVTADQTGQAASTAAAGIPPGCLYLDGNYRALADGIIRSCADDVSTVVHWPAATPTARSPCPTASH